MKESQKQIFQRFQEIQLKVRSLGDIFQNEGVQLTDESLHKFTEQADSAINELKSLKAAVIVHFDDSIDPIGEWNDNKKCFWFNANGYEYIAYKSSNKVLVYESDNDLESPFQVIAHTEKIETLRDFTNAIQNGTVYE